MGCIHVIIMDCLCCRHDWWSICWFDCHPSVWAVFMSSSWTAFAADMIGGVFAGLTAIHLYGDHAKSIDPLMPWGEKHHDKSVSKHTQVCGTTTHSLSHLLLARSLTHSRTMTRVSAAITRYVVQPLTH